jgi:hypothetical protein
MLDIISTVLAIISLIAIIVLFIIYYTSNDSTTIEENINVPLQTIINVTQAGQLVNQELSSSYIYLLDGVIDIEDGTIIIPMGGLSILGTGFNVSKLISSVNNVTLFTSPENGSGDILLTDIAIEITGFNSQVYNVNAANNFPAFELNKCNYNNCSSLGTVNGYRQGLESGTGRFGGFPKLTLSGVWTGGYFIDTSIVRSLDIDFTGSLFSAGSNFIMNSRFRTNFNVDLSSNSSLLDFSPENFGDSSLLQLQDCLITRDGINNSNDINLTPNISAGDLQCNWKNNIGLPNTVQGGKLVCSTEIITPITVINQSETLLGTMTASNLEHFTSPSNGQLKFIGSVPQHYTLTLSYVVSGNANDVIQLRVMKHQLSDGLDVQIGSTQRVINNSQGPNDVAYFVTIMNVILNTGDYLYVDIANVLATNNVTLELSSEFMLY